MNVRTYPITTKLKPNGIEEKGNRQEQKESRKGYLARIHLGCRRVMMLKNR
ncbi:hypothetical protein HanXRQr2_Chr11g0504221 [Helianthus annuus]|uniref:Uncharacterized protein n=1 Tax=Helianthus annuus TaxID=4232 RepID=A0A9K3HRK9_HELAN|nr:hypothetical protein HanXRQr2_Chr11g0504221 [Helianthus annuus]